MFTTYEITDDGDVREHFTGTAAECERALVALHRSGRYGIVRPAGTENPLEGTVLA